MQPISSIGRHAVVLHMKEFDDQLRVARGPRVSMQIGSAEDSRGVQVGSAKDSGEYPENKKPENKKIQAKNPKNRGVKS